MNDGPGGVGAGGGGQLPRAGSARGWEKGGRRGKLRTANPLAGMGRKRHSHGLSGRFSPSSPAFLPSLAARPFTGGKQAGFDHLDGAGSSQQP